MNRLLMASAAVVAVAAVLVSVVSLPGFFERSAVRAFNAGAQERGLADAEHMAHIFYYSVWAPVQDVRPGLTFQETVHPAMMDVFSTRSTFGLDISSLSLWSTDGETVWRGDPDADISSLAAEEWFQRLTADGTPRSISATVASGDVIRTFVPLRDEAADSGMVGNVVGVLELDRDVTEAIGVAAAAGRSIGYRAGLVAGAVALLVGVLGWTAWNARLSNLKTTVSMHRSEIREANAQAAQSTKLATMGELTASVAHELNNPLTSIWGVSQVMAIRNLKEPEASEVALIMREAERMSRIVQNLLSFARAGDSDKTLTSINSAIGSALELRQYHLMVSNIAVETRLDDTLPRTKADPHKIQQVVLNLIGNAEQAMLKVKNGGHLIVETKRVGDDIVLTVSDDGPGIAKETIEHIFDPFYTTKSAGDGTGLGLAISDTIIREHQGSIQVESELGLGTTFTVIIPITGEAKQLPDTLGSERFNAYEPPKPFVPKADSKAETATEGTQEDEEPLRYLAGKAA